MSTLSPEKLNSSFANHSFPTADDTYMDNSWHDPPSSPFVSHIEQEDQENIAPAQTPIKAGNIFEDEPPQSVFKISSPFKSEGPRERTSPGKMSPVKGLPDAFSSKNLLDIVSPSKMSSDEFEAALLAESTGSRGSPSPKKSSPVKRISLERPQSAMSNRSRMNFSPAKSSRAESVESTQRLPEAPTPRSATPENRSTPSTRPSSSHMELDLHQSALRDNEGLTVAMKFEETYSESHESSTAYHIANRTSALDDRAMGNIDYNPDGPDFTSLDMGMDDTMFSTFSEMPGIDMTKFAAIGKQSPTRNGLHDQV
jgi:hypothetical protein